jgi:hypothetical protein
MAPPCAPAAPSTFNVNMRPSSLLLSFLIASSMLACGGGTSPNAKAGDPTKLLANTVAAATTVVIPGMRASYTITRVDTGFSVADTVGGNGTKLVPANARLRFDDMSLAPAFYSDTTGQAYRLYQAAFNRTPDLAGLGYWIGAMDQGMSLNDVAVGFIGSDEFQAQYASAAGNAAMIAKFYQNVLHREGEAAGVAYWGQVLDTHAATLAQVLIGFSEGDENKLGTLQAIGDGVAFLENGVIYVPAARAIAAQNAVTGSTVSLDGSASTVSIGATPVYAWSLTSRPAGSNAILGSTSSARTSLMADVSGTYIVRLTVGDGHATSAPFDITVTAALAPSITTAPANQSVALGAAATFSVLASGDAPMSYQWQRNGADIAGATGARYVLPAATFADANSSFRVIIRNAKGSVTSAPATLGVTGIAVLAGSSVRGSNDGIGAAATFYAPNGMTVDAAGNVYITDGGAIRKITPAGVVSTLAGSAEQRGYADGIGAQARFRYPDGLAVDQAGNVFVADTGNNTIRKVTPSGVVSTFAGNARSLFTYAKDGTGTDALFSGLLGMTIDSAGNLYVADTFNNVIRKVSPGAVVTTLAGGNALRTADGVGSAAGFFMLHGLTVDAAGTAYAIDSLSRATIRKISRDGLVSTIAGGEMGSVDGLGAAAKFDSPQYLTVDADANLFVSDSQTIRKVTPAGMVTTVAGTAMLNPPSMAIVGALPGSGIWPRGIATTGHGVFYVCSALQILEIHF